MNDSRPPLATPVHLKTDDNMAWPTPTVFYLLAGNGLCLCRNHPFFESCVPAPRWPSELAAQRPFLRPRYPKLPRRMLEHLVGFFSRVADLHNSEAAALLAWDTRFRRLRVVVPEQVGTVSRNGWGSQYPIGLEYEAPTSLPSGWMIIGDVHCHVDYAAYASYTDKTDEQHRAGLHIVVGRIRREPPEFHVEAVVDGTRFRVAPELVLEGYHCRRNRIPASWLGRVKIKTWGKTSSKPKYGCGSSQYVVGARDGGSSYGYGYGYGTGYRDKALDSVECTPEKPNRPSDPMWGRPYDNA